MRVVLCWSCALSSSEENRQTKTSSSSVDASVSEANQAAGSHIPVMLEEVLQVFQPVIEGNIVDGTFGAGGYSNGLLKLGANILAIDRDETVQTFANDLKKKHPKKFEFRIGEFSSLDEIAEDNDFLPVDGVVLDIGVSSMQLDQAERGFSFMREGPLDMRMGESATSAADLVNSLGERELLDIIFAYGEEKRAKAIAKAIVVARKDQPITSTGQLAKLIEEVIKTKPGQKHPATKTFQALRIAVNREFDQLVKGLFAAEKILRDGGWLGVVTFHSLEDRIVKRFFDAQKNATSGSRHMPQAAIEAPCWGNISKPQKATTAEIARNPRARSATLRFAQRSGQNPRRINFTGLGVPLAKGVKPLRGSKSGREQFVDSQIRGAA
ncbi:16S rRNA (cytosine(1402)-N(4))-methyltransferase [hydrothermal vent metagenome]|uniref:16S rRNA (Cytosine(1402)-N(4))-methyltransferase n=1 Tax=hydrothermal vent metagenome TaxID=652676 RepID=A0A3B0UKJ4_9ZZZZ